MQNAVLLASVEAITSLPSLGGDHLPWSGICEFCLMLRLIDRDPGML